ncbi:MAG: matrixin family metalloprotease, partial [Pirellulaceae bacterium]|nr:matrixin family metalloprotease [Pirellulaceae bacterium]
LVTEDNLAPIVAEALDRIEKSAGFEAGALLESVTVEIADLPGKQLGQSLDNTVWIDVDAAGYGWFIDATPGNDVEFSQRTATDELMATFGSPARGWVDLLTTVVHELGHVLGLEHADGSGVMNELLPLSTRRLFDDDILPIEEWQNVADRWDPVDVVFRSLGQRI